VVRDVVTHVEVLHLSILVELLKHVLVKVLWRGGWRGERGGRGVRESSRLKAAE
jgi:hypothetical protein